MTAEIVSIKKNTIGQVIQDLNTNELSITGMIVAYENKNGDVCTMMATSNEGQASLLERKLRLSIDWETQRFMSFTPRKGT